MADKTLRTRISLRRDDAVKFDSDFIPLNGEVLFVNTDDNHTTSLLNEQEALILL